MPQVRIKIAKPDILSLFENSLQRIFRYSDITKILEENRAFWRLALRTNTSEFIKFLKKEGELEEHTMNFPNCPITRYTWGEVPLYEFLQTLRSKTYFSHYTAIYIHELTEQIPKTIFLNQEQSPKFGRSGPLEQKHIDDAFSRPARATNNYADHRDHRICLLSGKSSDMLGVIETTAPDDSNVRVTNIERTLIDATVRPEYCGGVFEVLKAYRLAKGKISINRLSAFLKKLDYIYPYGQAVGFFLERTKTYKESSIRLFQRKEFDFDFYLGHNMENAEYSAKWRLYFPKGF